MRLFSSFPMTQGLQAGDKEESERVTSELKLKDVDIDGQQYQDRYLKYSREGYQYQSLVIEQEKDVERVVQPREDENKLDNLLQTKENEIIFQSLKQIDKKSFLMNLLNSTNLNKLSSEILKISHFAKPLYRNQSNDQLISFLISLDFQIKGLLSHWQIRLGESNKTKGKSTQLMKGLDVKFPILIGDQYHTIAYFIVARLGNIELTRILTVIEENFQKIFFNKENISNNFEQNLKHIYKHFFNYLPTFFGLGFKGVAVIFKLGQDNINVANDAGVELGFFFQFAIFSYIMIGVTNQASKDTIKQHLNKISSILQYLSFETIEAMLYQMKTLNLGKLKNEFLMLTIFHGHNFNEQIQNLEIDESIKTNLTQLVSDYTKELLNLAEFDPNHASFKQHYQTMSQSYSGFERPATA